MIGSGNKITKERLQEAVKTINEMIWMSRTDSSIDVNDLMIERDNVYKALNKLRRDGIIT